MSTQPWSTLIIAVCARCAPTSSSARGLAVRPTLRAPAKSRFVRFVPAPCRPGVRWQAARRVASRERLETNSDISVLCRGLARGGAASLPVALTAPSRGMCSALTAHPSLLTGSAASHGSNCRGIALPNGGLLPWSRRAAGIGAWPSPREEPPCLPACQRSSTSLPSSASLGARSRDWAAPRSRAGSICSPSGSPSGSSSCSSTPSSASFLEPGPRQSRGLHKMPEHACSGNLASGLANAVAWRWATPWSTDKRGRIPTLPEPCPIPTVLTEPRGLRERLIAQRFAVDL